MSLEVVSLWMFWIFSVSSPLWWDLPPAWLWDQLLLALPGVRASASH